MSDSQRRYEAVKEGLRQALGEQRKGSEARFINLSLMVSGLVKAKDLTQDAIASEMPLMAQNTSLAQRQRRWLMNEKVAQERYYQPVIKPYLNSLRGATIPLILDTTSSGVNSHLLTVAVGYQRRALPIMWEGGSGKRGHTGGERQVGLLEKVKELLPKQEDIILLGDGEFGNTTLLSWLQDREGWNYCLRVAKDTLILYEGEWGRVDSFDVNKGEVIWLENIYLTQTDTFGPVNLLLTWDETRNRLVAIVSNLPLPQEVLYWYKKRFWIEPLFGDIKGHGFDFQTSRLRHPERLARLMLAIALAYLWLCFLGAFAIITQQAKFVDRTDRRDRSIFTIGRQFLSRLLKLDLPIPVRFLPLPFLSLLPKAGLL